MVAVAYMGLDFGECLKALQGKESGPGEVMPLEIVFVQSPICLDAKFFKWQARVASRVAAKPGSWRDSVLEGAGGKYE